MYVFFVSIAKVIVKVTAIYESTMIFFKDFIVEKMENYDFEIVISKDEISKYHMEHSEIPIEWAERVLVKYYMDTSMVDYGVVSMHSSAISFDGKALVFTALSGVGKSTHAKLWREYYGDRVEIINDDRPSLRIEEDCVYACGHPQSGKHILYSNVIRPIKMICKLVRDDENYVKRINKYDFYPYLVQQIFTMDKPETTRKVLKLINKMMNLVEFYEIHCNMDPEVPYIINKQLEDND